ncbi:MAG: TetR/AcrR family transcriptional regulator [Solirubrobacterales bacterium]
MRTASTPTPSPRSSAKRTAVLDAAQHCFLEHGYAGTSMDMVAHMAGVSKATIYAHFKSKDELFGAIIRRRCERQLSFESFQGLGESDARTALTAMARHLLDLLLSPEALGIYRVVVAESLRQPELAQAYFEAGPVRGKAAMVAVVEALIARGEIAAADPARAVDQFVGMLRGEHYNRALIGLPIPDGLTVEATIAATVDTFLKAFTPPHSAV